MPSSPSISATTTTTSRLVLHFSLDFSFPKPETAREKRAFFSSSINFNPIITHRRFLSMSREKLLRIEPQELTFRLEVGKQASCTIRLSNNTRNHVAFKFMTTTPAKYRVQPSTEILSPGSSRSVVVTMAAPNEAPSDDTQCKDTFLIKSVSVGPGDRVEQSQKLFRGRKYVDGDCKLRVVYVLPSNTREEASSINRSKVKERSLRDDTKQQDSNGWNAGDFLMKGITVGVLGFIFWYLVLKFLPLLWSLTFIITMFVIKMAKWLVSDSIEDWIVKTMLYLSLHSFTALFRRRQSRNANDSRVSNVT